MADEGKANPDKLEIPVPDRPFMLPLQLEGQVLQNFIERLLKT
jgi:hypothetical protein